MVLAVGLDGEGRAGVELALSDLSGANVTFLVWMSLGRVEWLTPSVTVVLMLTCSGETVSTACA